MDINLQEFARKGLQAELTRLDAERGRIMTLLAELNGTSRSATAAAESTPAVRRTRTMSPEGRQRIQEAVRRRWERVRAQQASETAGSNAEAASTGTGKAPESAGNAATPTRRTGRFTKRAGGRKK